MRINELVSYVALGTALASPMACGDENDAKSLCDDVCDAYNGCCDRGIEDFCKVLDNWNVHSGGCVSNCESFIGEGNTSEVYKGDICLYEHEDSCEWGSGSRQEKCLEEHG
ncbi:hypothetical protein KKG31_01310 [Patescibacteria group bacterium]|nr:hypothetical protein [Candidatus Micrarchaeota archaeon]MBU1757816.1 hypothetical protein [Patescibacteria group bacterium]